MVRAQSIDHLLKSCNVRAGSSLYEYATQLLLTKNLTTIPIEFLLIGS